MLHVVTSLKLHIVRRASHSLTLMKNCERFQLPLLSYYPEDYLEPCQT